MQTITGNSKYYLSVILALSYVLCYLQTIEGKNIQSLQNSSRPEKSAQDVDHTTDNIPEDLFRRYTDTDSRPLTPTPTVTSIHTRTSAGSFLNNRRCITPELGKTDIIKRKKIILDLRKSHSQETLYWKPASDLSSGLTDQELKTRSAGANEDKKAKKQKSDEQRPKSSLAATTTILEEETLDDSKKTSQTCINEQDYGDEDIRRGKKRKKMKTVASAYFTSIMYISSYYNSLINDFCFSYCHHFPFEPRS